MSEQAIDVVTAAIVANYDYLSEERAERMREFIGEQLTAALGPPLERARSADAIVRNLAAISPLWMNGECVLCGADTRADLGHAAECPWRLAHEYIARHPHDSGK